MAVKDRLAGPGLSWADVNLILETYGVGTYTPDDPWGSNDFLDVVKAATDEQLVEQKLVVDAGKDAGRHIGEVWKGPYGLFGGFREMLSVQARASVNIITVV